MKIRDEYKKIILKDFDFAISSMREADTITVIMYHFSALHGVLNRIFNLEYSSTLVFIHDVLSNCYKAIMARMSSKFADPLSPVIISDELLDYLVDAVETLRHKIEAEEEVYSTLELISNLAYMTTGNGFYLLAKGAAKLEKIDTQSNKKLTSK
jgi:hypothetical protein